MKAKQQPKRKTYAEYQSEQFSTLIGYTVVQVATSPAEEFMEGMCGLIVAKRMPDGTIDRKIVWVQQDDECNGPGALGIEPYTD